MRIAILTLHPTLNYGCILQAYALQTVLRRMGHEATTLDVEEQYRVLPLRLFLCNVKRLIKKMIDRPCEPFSYERQWEKDQMTLSQYTRPFIAKHIRQDHYQSFRSIPSDRYQALVVGSDQVWRAEYFGTRIFRHAFLAFAWHWPHTRRVAYAASLGKPEWSLSKRDTRLCRILIQRFDAVALRENDAVELCRHYLGVEAPCQVLDPTLLLSPADYCSLLADRPARQGILLCYILDRSERNTAIINRLAAELHLTPVYVGKDFLDRSLPIPERIQPPVEDFLQGFRDASFVVTDSFHGSAFSINFRRPFVAIVNEGRGLSRFHSLAALFHVEGRLVTSSWQGTAASLPAIDWNDVTRRHDEWKERSMAFLTHSLTPSTL